MTNDVDRLADRAESAMAHVRSLVETEDADALIRFCAERRETDETFAESLERVIRTLESGEARELISNAKKSDAQWALERAVNNELARDLQPWAGKAWDDPDTLTGLRVAAASVLARNFPLVRSRDMMRTIARNIFYNGDRLTVRTGVMVADLWSGPR